MKPHVAIVLSLLALGASACKRGGAPASADPAADPAFEAKWSDLAQAGIEVAYIEDDRGEGLMGSVRRSARLKPEPPPAPATAPSPAAAVPGSGSVPDQLLGDDVQRVIRSNLGALKGCYLTMSRQGSIRSGKAIVTFAIGADGRPAAIRVDAPTFKGTPLPSCLTNQISFWSFPRSHKGGGVVSYPFVFVSG